MKAVTYAIKQVIKAVYPNTCAGCGRIIPEEDGFCYYCFEMLPKVNLDKFCTRCESAKEDCRCNHYAYHFEAAVAPYYNYGVARKAMYNFKFHRKEYFVLLFAKNMALAVQNAFYDVKFDAVAYVPASMRNELKRGYNQSRELAILVSEKLNIKLLDNAIGCRKKRQPQHKTRWEDRFKNVRDVYFANTTLKGRTVLLVDDIKTSGATLDECAKVLKSAGADRVYCVTALATKRKAKKRK